jgi:coenzyme F420-dependent glucose-6-phosphate dehydrogenase
MTSWGFTLSSEEQGPGRLLDLAVQAEEAGFDFLTVSDHYHPWVSAQGESPFVWTTLGAVAARTRRVRVGTGVTCPIMRIHPAVVAHAVATTAALFEGRFFFGVGSGEALNEHVTGARWPAPEIRLEMLREAIDVMRKLWTGDVVDHWGTHYTVENARLYTLPAEPPELIVSSFGPKAAQVAAECGDGVWITKPNGELLQQWEQAGGKGPRYGQVNLCWSEDAEEAKRTAFRLWPNAGVPGQLSQDLPTPSHFEMASENVTADMIADSIPCGPDPEPVIEQVRQFLDAGFDHLHIHQIGYDQEGFFRFWARELRPRLDELRAPVQVGSGGVSAAET